MTIPFLAHLFSFSLLKSNYAFRNQLVRLVSCVDNQLRQSTATINCDNQLQQSTATINCDNQLRQLSATIICDNQLRQSTATINCDSTCVAFLYTEVTFSMQKAEYS
jgi:hypothetical protein